MNHTKIQINPKKDFFDFKIIKMATHVGLINQVESGSDASTLLGYMFFVWQNNQRSKKQEVDSLSSSEQISRISETARKLFNTGRLKIELKDNHIVEGLENHPDLFVTRIKPKEGK